MRKVTLLVAILLAAAVSTSADAAKKKAAKAPAMSEQDRSNTFIRDAFQPWNTTLATPKMKAKKKKS